MPIISRIGAAAARGFGLFGKIAAIKDAYFNYVTLLLPGNGTNGAQNNTFLDSSSNAFTITRNGNTTQGNFSPFSQTGWGNYFNGTTDALSIGGSGAWAALSTGNFTVECWIYITSNTATQVIADARGTTSSLQAWQFYTNASGKLVFMYGAASLTGATTIVANQWVHVAAVRSGTTITLYINGTADGTATSIANLSGGATTYLGRTFDTTGTVWYAGYISNFRTVIGTAVYTANFTPSTTPLTAISGTSLLTCQSNRFLDSSSNAYAITTVGSPSVQAFSPFAPTAAWSASTNGGSGYFDGSGDYLTVASNSVFNIFNQTNATVEFWFNPSAYSVDQDAICYYVDGNNFWMVQFAGGQANKPIKFYTLNAGVTVTLDVNQSSTTFLPNQWNHCAFVKSGSTWSSFINGSRVATAGTAPTINFTGTLYIGSRNTTVNPITGYLSGLRITNTVEYSGTTYTVPTAPPTAISGTGFLANYTNGGIVDATAKNDLETVGNAQISTTQSKFGGSSMSFNGTNSYLVTDAPSTNLFAFGTGDFTIEFWLYLNSTSGTPIIYDGRPSGTNTTQPTIYMNGAVITYFTNGANQITGSSLSISTWYHIALCRVSSQTKMFVNGTQAGSTYADTTNYSNTTSRPVIGVDGNSGNTNYFNGYIDDLRVTKGVGRYSANFTAPTAGFPVQ